MPSDSDGISTSQALAAHGVVMDVFHNTLLFAHENPLRIFTTLNPRPVDEKVEIVKAVTAALNSIMELMEEYRFHGYSLAQTLLENRASFDLKSIRADYPELDEEIQRLEDAKDLLLGLGLATAQEPTSLIPAPDPEDKDNEDDEPGIGFERTAVFGQEEETDEDDDDPDGEDDTIDYAVDIPAGLNRAAVAKSYADLTLLIDLTVGTLRDGGGNATETMVYESVAAWMTGFKAVTRAALEHSPVFHPAVIPPVPPGGPAPDWRIGPAPPAGPSPG